MEGFVEEVAHELGSHADVVGFGQSEVEKSIPDRELQGGMKTWSKVVWREQAFVGSTDIRGSLAYL